MAGLTTTTIKKLFAFSGNTCAFPKCREPLYSNGVLIGEVCHIKSEKPGAARYNPSLTDADRHSYDNIILLCANHHTVIDKDEKTYTVERLVGMKREHESKQTARFSITDAEAIRLAIFTGGTVAGAVASTIASSIGDIVRAVSEIDPTRRKKSEARDLSKLLKRIGPGGIAHYSDHKIGKAIGNQFVILFFTEGWKVAELDLRRADLLQRHRPNTLLFLLSHEHQSAFEVVSAILDTYLNRIGFKRVDAANWKQDKRVLRVVLAKLARY